MCTTLLLVARRLGLVLALAAASSAAAGIWIEQGDAPSTMPGQATGGTGPLMHIQGQLQSHFDVDVFCIQIVDPWAFMASTLGGAAFDTQLFLFEPGGMGITHNDNASPVDPQSMITGQFVPVPGVYAIAISAFNRDAVNTNVLPIWEDAPFDIERPPDGPGAPGPLASWIGAGVAWGNYQIELFGCEFWGPPCTPVVIVAQPQSQDIQEGEPFSLSVVAVGTPPITYQWYYAGQPIPGANGPIYSILSAGPGDVGRYYVTATNPCGFDRSRRARVRVFRPGEPPPAPYCCWVPEVWQEPDFYLNVDENQDGVDDVFEVDPQVQHRALVLWWRCPSDEDVAAITSMSEEITLLHAFCTISVTALGGIDYARAAAIREMEGVVAVQVSRVLEASLDTSVQAIRVASGFYSPDTVNDLFPWLTGASVNIAIFDTGVDDPGGPGVTHTSLPAAIFGYNSVPDVGVVGNPDDDHFHGTHVASIALGRGIAAAFGPPLGGPGVLSPGVASGANLEDYKVLDSDGMGEEWKIMRATEVALRRDEADVFNFSLGAAMRSDGNDAFSQLINRSVELGVTVVAAAGNNFPGQVGWAPAAAARAITVAAANNMETPDRTDDAIAGYSAAGPRLEDSDADLRDELKPEVTAPGSVITGALLDTPDGTLTISGTSMATPHVAGVAALLIEAMPSINAGSVKQGILETAEPRGGASWPARDPLWNDRWGFGYVDAYALLDLLYTCQPADLRFDTVTSSDPWNPWESPEIGIDPDPPIVGEENRIIVNIYNAGPGDASDVLVEFGVYTFTGASPTYNHIATVPVASIPRYTWAVVETPWWPPQRGKQCLQVEIGYLCDGNFSNNKARRNINETRSPAYFEARNLFFDAPTEITFVRLNDNPDWELQITPPSVTMNLDDPPQIIEALPIPAFGTPAGTVERIRVGAYANGLLLGGVTIDAVMRDCNGNGYEDWFDIRDGRSTDLNGNGIPDDCECWGDLDLDGVIGLADLSALLTNFGLSGGMFYAQGDLDGDGDVDLADLSRLLESYGATCP
ncbi:MAG: S8 family serine peptidase [Phycisphaerae bacterium]|jgi:subtilisin family serine protease